MNVVTGAFSYTGKYIPRRLLAMGEPVRTLTGHPRRPDPFEGRVEVLPLAFDRPADLARSGVTRIVHVSITGASTNSRRARRRPIPHSAGLRR